MEKFTLEAASDSYRTKREDLRQAEIALTKQRETVAAMRRDLQTDTPVPEDYTFQEVTGPVRLSELFGEGQEALIVAHYMWAPDNEAPCPMCTMWHDGYNAVLPHIAHTAQLVVVAKQDANTVRAFGDGRGWSNLRIVSSGGTSFNRDFGMEDEDGNQFPGVSVFLKKSDGTVRHAYTVSAIMGDDHYRGMDLLSPVWNMLDLLPQGRGNFMPSVAYE
jgi:predicted dithiol-disulfide oxidoreductase (DUF899 family)